MKIPINAEICSEDLRLKSTPEMQTITECMRRLTHYYPDMDCDELMFLVNEKLKKHSSK